MGHIPVGRMKPCTEMEHGSFFLIRMKATLVEGFLPGYFETPVSPAKNGSDCSAPDLLQRAESSDFPADDQGMNVVCTLVGVHGL